MRSALAAIQIVATLGFMATAPASAQSPSIPKPDTPQSESTGPQDARSTGSRARANEPLSERLSETGGVIRPPENIAPDIAIRPADPGTTRVIPPPGSSGGNPTVQPQ